MFLNNKYTKWYLQLMQSRKGLVRDCYTENHHIIPFSLGGENVGTNMVRLTAREHFIAHLLLPFMLMGHAKRKMMFALGMMRGKGARVEIYIPSSRIYEICRRSFSEAQRNRTVSKETRAKMSASSKGRRLSVVAKEKIRQASTGRKASPETIAKLRAIHLGSKRPPRSEEWKIKQRASHLGRKDPPSGFANRSKAHAGANNPTAKTWTLETENGVVFKIQSLKTWCRENNINEHYLKTRQTFTSGYRLLKKV